MNNKQLGTKFEHTLCEKLNQNGWWVHFCTPNSSGAQPCDIIACKNGITVLIDCKTCVASTFSTSRVEFNQAYSMQKFRACGNGDGKCFFAVLHDEKIYMLPYDEAAWSKRASFQFGTTYLFENWEKLWNIVWMTKST